MLGSETSSVDRVIILLQYPTVTARAYLVDIFDSSISAYSNPNLRKYSNVAVLLLQLPSATGYQSSPRGESYTST